jgi:hypothetical protein
MVLVVEARKVRPYQAAVNRHALNGQSRMVSLRSKRKRIRAKKAKAKKSSVASRFDEAPRKISFWAIRQRGTTALGSPRRAGECMPPDPGENNCNGAM